MESYRTQYRKRVTFVSELKVAVFDVDGTLFDYRNHRIHETTVQAIHALKRKGFTIVVATSRSYPELSEDLLSRIAADYYVAASGNCIQDAQGRVLFSARFTYEQVERVKNLALKYDMGLTLKYGHCNCLYTYPFEMQKIFCNIGHTRCPSIYYEDMNFHHSELPVGFTIWGENGKRDLFCDALAAYPNDYRMEKFQNGVVADIFHPHTNKMTALADLIRRLGFSAENCIAFGDGGNDVEMIQWAGVGVAMGNACDELKAVADKVCGTTWEDGIAQALCALGVI